MTAPRELLDEAGQTLRRAELLLERAAATLGPPTDEPLRLLASDVTRLRRRIRAASTTATTVRRGGDGRLP